MSGRVLFLYMTKRFVHIIALISIAQCAFAQEVDYATTYSSSVTLSTDEGVSASKCKVQIDGVTYDAIKAGTSSVAGEVELLLPPATGKLHVHLAGWKGEGRQISVQWEGKSQLLTINPDDGVSKQSPYVLQNDPSTMDYFVLDVNTGKPCAVRFSATKGKRFVIFGVNAEMPKGPMLVMDDNDWEWNADLCHLGREGFDYSMGYLNYEPMNITGTLKVSVTGEDADKFKADVYTSPNYIIGVYYKSSELGQHKATLHFASELEDGTEEAFLDIPLYGETQGTCLVHWMVDGKPLQDTEVWQGEKISSYPTAPAWTADEVNRTFIGWSPAEVEEGKVPNVIIKDRYSTFPVNHDITLHAVYGVYHENEQTDYWELCTALSEIDTEGEYLIAYESNGKQYYLKSIDESDPSSMQAVELKDIDSIPRGAGTWCTEFNVAGEENAKDISLRSMYIGEDGELYYGGYLYTNNKDNGLGVKPYGRTAYTKSFWRVTCNDGYFRMTRDYTNRDLVGINAGNVFASYPVDDKATNHKLLLYRWIGRITIWYDQYISRWTETPPTPTAMDTPKDEVQPYKVFDNGQLHIVRSNQVYRIDGQVEQISK